MKKKFLVMQIPVVLFFTALYLVSDLGDRGDLGNATLRDKVYPLVSRAAHAFTDFKFNVRGSRPVKNKIVVIEIDSPAIERIGRWPWHRDATAYLIDKVFEAGAKVVGLDMVFSEADQRIPDGLQQALKSRGIGNVAAQFETDPQLDEVIKKYSDRLVLGWTSDLPCQPLYDGRDFCAVTDPEAKKLFSPGFDKFAIEQFHTDRTFDPATTPLLSYVTPLANINSYTQSGQVAGYFSATPDLDGYIRRSNIFVIADGKPYPSLPLRMAAVGLKDQLRLNLNAQDRVKSLGFVNSGRTIPVSPMGTLLVNFRGPHTVFHHISAVDILSEKDLIDDVANRELAGVSKKEILKDAFVLIGVSAVGVFDMRQFPLESNAPGVYGHANILDNILSGDPLISGATGFSSFYILLLMLSVIVFAFAIEKLEAVPALALFLATFLFLGLWDFKFMFGRNYNLNSVYLYVEIGTIFILTLAAKYVLEERNKKFIRGAFSKYVAPVVVDSILKDPTKLSLGGEKRELSILFSDIRGFTTFSEQMDAKGLAAFLNDYLGIMTGLVFSHQGTLDKYIGDAIMAFWGAPLNQPEHALNACKAAVQMMKALAEHQPRFKSQYGIDVKVGIGINSGVVNVGNMGSEQTFEYTVIGDHVNLASRVEGLTKKYGAAIITTRLTLDCIEKAGLKPLPYRVLDDVKVKGKKNAVELVHVFEKDYSAEGLEVFEEARQLYRSQKWLAAAEKFQRASQLLAAPGEGDGPSVMYIERCEFFRKQPPATDWDGSWEMDSK
jgi:adenylate cyclase